MCLEFEPGAAEEEGRKAQSNPLSCGCPLAMHSLTFYIVYTFLMNQTIQNTRETIVGHRR